MNAKRLLVFGICASVALLILSCTFYVFHSKPIHIKKRIPEHRSDLNTKLLMQIGGKDTHHSNTLREIDAQANVYMWYCDSTIQINLKVIEKKIQTIAIRTAAFYLWLDIANGIDIFLMPDKSDLAEQQITQLDYFLQTFTITTDFCNITGLATTNPETKNKTIEFTSQITNHHHPSQIGIDIAQPSSDWADFLIIENYVFSRHTKARSCMVGNALEHSKKNASLIMRLDGDVNINTGHAEVNRKMWFLLSVDHTIAVTVNDSPSTCKKSNCAILDLYIFIYERYAKLCRRRYGLIFQNRFPPKFIEIPKHIGYIHQQPWEWSAIPDIWHKPFETSVDELWVPSAYNRDIFIKNSVAQEKIHVIPHGIDNLKYKFLRESENVRDVSHPFTFLSVGGDIPRKGFDILLEAYLEAFSVEDNVKLVVHSNYEKWYSLHLGNATLNSSLPKVEYEKKDRPKLDVIKMFLDADVYVSPYRSEGFGLTILEAMALGLPVIVPNFGPAPEFCTDENAWFIDTVEEECDIPPCMGGNTIFKWDTRLVPTWGKPDAGHLAKLMREAYENPDLAKQKGEKGKELALNYEWSNIGTFVRDRVKGIVAKKPKKPTRSTQTVNRRKKKSKK